MVPPGPQQTPDGPGTDPADAEDRGLIARIARQDRSALEQLYRRHAGWMTVRLESRCGDPEMADIALQDTFLAVWRSADRYRGDGQVGGWLWGIAVRRLIDQLRKRKPTPISPRRLQLYDEAMAFEDRLIDNGVHGPMGHALRTLDPDLQAVLIATAIDGLTTKEAAKLLGIPTGTVKTRLMRARRRLQEVLS